MERELRASSQRGDSFGSDNLVMVVHGITASLHTHSTSGPASKYYMAHFDDHFNNIAAAATNVGLSLDQLAATTTMQYT